MKRKLNLLSLLILASTIASADNLVGFGDSISDTGNLARFTYNSGKLYNEHLANYLGEAFPEPNGGASTLLGGVGDAIPPSLVGPNFAQGGSTVNENLGMGTDPISSRIKFQTGKQMRRFFELNKDKKDFSDTKAIYWIGGNDMRIVAEGANSEEGIKIINKSTEDIKKQVAELSGKGIKFIIVPTVPDISYTPKFFKLFAKTYKIDGEKLFTEKSGWFFPTGLDIKELDTLLDEPSKNSGNLDVIIKDSIKKLLEKQNMNSTEESVNKWFNAYKTERAKLSQEGNYFNDKVSKNLQEIQKENKDLKILRPDTALMIKEVVEHPESYGFTNFTGSASNTFSDALSDPRNMGAGSGRDRLSAFEPEDGKDGRANLEKKHLWNKGYHYLFADEFHPSPEGHKIVSEYMMNLLETKDGKTLDDKFVYRDEVLKDQTVLLKVDKETKVVKDNKEYEKGYVHFGAIRVKNGGKLDYDGLNLKNSGVAISAADKDTTVKVENFNIKNSGKISSAIEVYNGANVSMNKGSLESERGSRISYPVGIRINGKDSTLNFNDSKLKMNGTGSVGMSIGNRGEANINSSEISMNGTGNKGIHLWNSNAVLTDSKINSQEGVWIFGNSKEDVSNLSLENSQINSQNYAVDISKNMTGNNVYANISSNNSQINGGIITEEGSVSNISMNNTMWNMNKNSSVTNLNINNSRVHFSAVDSKNFSKLAVNGDYKGENSSLHMRGDIRKTNSETDLLQIDGKTSGKTLIDYKNVGRDSVSSTEIKIVDAKKGAAKDAFTLVKPVYAGDYEYALMNKNEKDNSKYFYLTSSMVIGKNGETVQLLRPKVAFESMASHGNMEANFQNIFHIKDRDKIYFTVETTDKTLSENNNNEIKTKNNITKLSYPLAENYGMFFSASRNSMDIYDNTRTYFNKDNYLGNLDRKDYNVGIYFEHSFAKKIYFDHTLQYEWVTNKYEVEDTQYKKSGHGVGASSKAYYPIKITEHLEVSPHYQIDFFEHKIGGDHRNEIKNHVGADLTMKNDKSSISFGVEQENCSHENKIYYKIEGEIQLTEPLKVFGNMYFNDQNDVSYKIGTSYKF